MKIEKLPSGNYRVRVTIGHDADGKPIRKSFTNPDKTKLRRIAAEYADTHRGVSSNQTVSAALDAFLAAKTPVLSPSTIRAYTYMADTLKSKYARFCALKTYSVAQTDLQQLINSMVQDGRTPKTIRNYHGLLSAVFKFAGYPLPFVTLPRQGRPDIHIPEEDMMRRIMAAAKDTKLEVPVALGMMGLRRSEICALTVDDLDDNIIHIHKAAVYGTDGAVHVKQPKTYASDRYVRIPDEIAGKIREYGYVTDYGPTGLSHAFTAFLKSNGFPAYRLHDLRHFFVSYCHNVLKLSDAQIQAMTGHKTSVVLRNNYLHSMGDDETGELVSEKFASML